MKPTKGQKKEFWERCGIQYTNHQGQEGWVRPDIDFAFSSPPPITLDNLFKYAIPEIIKRDYEPNIYYWWSEELWQVDLLHFSTEKFISKKDTELVDALYWAIWEVLK